MASADKVYVYSTDEYKQFLDVKNPNYNDLRKSLAGNISISAEIKPLITNYIDKLENKFPNKDLSVFYYNFQNLKIVIEEVESIQKKANSERCDGFYSSTKNTIYLSKDYNETLLAHELSHLFHVSYIPASESTNDKNVYLYPYILSIDENMNYSHIGKAYNEGLTDLITEAIISDDYKQRSAYIKASDTVQTIANFLNEDIIEMSENGIINTINKMKNFGIENPIYDLEMMDFSLQCYLNNILFSTKIERNLYQEYYLNLAKKMLDDGKSKEEIYNKIKDYLDNGFLKKHLGDYEFVLSLDDADSLEAYILEYISNTLGNQERLKFDSETMSSKAFNLTNKKLCTNDKLYIYETPSYSGICYALADDKGMISMYDANTYNEIQENFVIRGEYVDKLIEAGVINDAYSAMNYDKWNEYFTLSENVGKTNDNIYVYSYEESEVKQNCSMAYIKYDLNGQPVFYDVYSNEKIDDHILGIMSVQTLEKNGIFKTVGYGPIDEENIDTLLNYLNEYKTSKIK